MTTTDPNLTERSGTQAAGGFDVNLEKRYFYDRIFKIAAWTATLIGLLVLAVLLIDTFVDGFPRLGWDFITNFPSRRPERAGVASALVGTVWLLSITALFAFPIGVGTGIFLQEFATDNWFTRAIEINISNLAAVPSIIYGLLGLAMFVEVLSPITGGRTLLSGGLTLALLILPVIIVATREALKAVPDSLRMAGMALGSTRWQTVWAHVLPQAMPGILTGTILALSRAIGETAPLIVIGAQTFVAFMPNSWYSSFSAMPIQIFNWTSRPQAEFHTNAAAGSIVLLVVLLMMNATAIYLRNRFQRAR
ncbi:phosphate ABC transporter permease PstA [Leptolyngbya sp. AN02str]|uniref:phosphate ABC transporter permease PstA n=1 Tax=Leptolyngbya sp. AN02str TaxID=3423363 RepID=UPI003D3130AD